MGKSDEPPKIDPFANNSSTAALPGMGVSETPPASSADESIMDAIAKDTTQLTGKPAAPASSAVKDRESALAAVDAALSAAPPAVAVASPVQPAQGPMQSASKSATPTLAELEAAAPASSASALPPMPDFSTLYFGGIKLGKGGLVRAYTAACKGAVEKACTAAAYSMIKLNVIVSHKDYSLIRGNAGPLYSIISEDFSDKVCCVLATDEEKFLQAKEKIEDMTSGRCEFQENGRFIKRIKLGGNDGAALL